jgi:hypothetical protein
MNRLIQLTTLKSLFHEIIAGKLTGLGFDSVQGARGRTTDKVLRGLR